MKFLTGVSAIGTLSASMVPQRYPCSRSKPWIRTFTLHASSFCGLETFWDPEKAYKIDGLEQIKGYRSIALLNFSVIHYKDKEKTTKEVGHKHY